MNARKIFFLTSGVIAAGLMVGFFLLNPPNGDDGRTEHEPTQGSAKSPAQFGDYPGPQAVGPDGKVYIKKKSPIDLAYLKSELPNNLYWKVSVPLTDPHKKKERAREKAKWSKRFGRIQSNAAEPEDIRLYYDYRRRVSEDHIAFMKLVVKKFGSKLKEKELGLIKVGLELHMARLKQIPRDMNAALTRRVSYLEKKKAWAKNK